MNSSSTSSSSLDREQPNLRRSQSTPSLYSERSTTAAYCGSAAAGCAALCCCCPCSVVNLVVLTLFKVPRELCRRAIRRLQRRQVAKNEILENGDSEKKLSKVGSSQFAIHPLESKDNKEIDKSMVVTEEDEEDEAVIALEKEMWSRFYSGGFWRSLSQAETTSSLKTE